MKKIISLILLIGFIFFLFHGYGSFLFTEIDLQQEIKDNKSNNISEDKDKAKNMQKANSEKDEPIGGRLPVTRPDEVTEKEETINNNRVKQANKKSINNQNSAAEVIVVNPQSEKKEETTKTKITSMIKEDKDSKTSRKSNNDKTKTSSVSTGNEKSLLDLIKKHTVKKGESLWKISRKYNIDINTLIGANDISNMNMIEKGDQLKILPVKGILYRINPGESLWNISRKFNVSMEKIIKSNNISSPDFIKPGKLLILPGAKPEFGYQERMSGKLMMPVQGRISSYYGRRWGKMHEGIDFAVNTGTRIKAAGSGKIIYSGWASGYGYTVIIEHQRGVRTLYAHNSKLLVHSGQYVRKGQAICLSGNTGNSTGPHLHFEVQINGRPVNPLSYID